MALGAIFVGGVAISGCGSAVPGDAVAVVAGNPISTRALAHWGYVAAVGQAQVSPGSPVIVPDPPNYVKCIASLKKIAPASIPHSELKSACVSQFQQTMEYLVRSAWVQGEAAARGIKVTPAQVMSKFTTAKNQQFKTTAQFSTFLSQTGQTINDILYRFRISLLAQKLATPAAVAAYYKQHLTSYSTPERRNVRIILTKTLSKANAAKAALTHGKSWAATAKQYSIDPATKNTGGLLADVVTGEEPAALSTVIFSAAKQKLEGPVKTPFGYYLAEVTSILPATTQSLAKESATIKSTLANTALSSPPWLKKWKAKTTCRAGFTIPDCKNYVAPKTTTTATPAPSTGATPTPTTSTPTPTTTTTTPKKK
ncbi:MAG TPA: peptidyl-prolyl cis-trans isomerase [Solirubrobacteraceae bacterium]|jgi:parvulin-like peptidyl-prolyl isomerase|nr:peptidyl-prolyl cis-trans isomerase [Solirubrobacteraceae bacterium]